MQVKYSFDRATMLKIGKGALIAGGGAVIVYVAQALQGQDFGAATPAVVAVCSIVINIMREYRKGDSWGE